ncbi:MAG: lipopolysaccharide biosynthesis protein [Bacteroidales bacterium]|nr:lipopolysaccharide biosynthesis protein [Bacteroidales bacterium]
MSSKATDTLKNAVAKSFLWGGLSNVVCQLLSVFFGVYLARLLGPEDYGPVGMLAIFNAIASSLQDSGFVSAIANRKKVGHDDYNAVFWFSVITSLVIYALLYAAAPLIAGFFNQPVLLWLARFNFLAFVLNGFGVAASAYLFRELKVKQRSIASVLALLVSGVAGILLAMNGYSYWGISAQAIIYTLVRLVVYWYYTPWHPSFTVRFYPLRYLFAFSHKLLITNIFQRINWNVFSFILGKFYSRADVGNYSKAADWFRMGSDMVNVVVNTVAQPVLARVVEDNERQLRVFRKMMRFTAFVSFPLLAWLSLVSHELIVVVLTDKWEESSRILQIMCLWGAFMPIQSMFTNLLVSRGRTDSFMWCTIVQGSLVLAMLLAMHPLGIKPMLVAYCLFNIAWLFVWCVLVRRDIELTIRMFLMDFVPFLLVTLVSAGIAGYLTRDIGNYVLLLVLRLSIASVLYIILSYLCRFEELREAVEYIFRRKKRD